MQSMPIGGRNTAVLLKAQRGVDKNLRGELVLFRKTFSIRSLDLLSSHPSITVKNTQSFMTQNLNRDKIRFICLLLSISLLSRSSVHEIFE